LIFLDLYFTLKNPFYPRIKRVTFYYVFLAFVIVFTSFNIAILNWYGANDIKLIDDETTTHLHMDIFYYPLTIILSIMTIISYVLVMKRLLKKGTSHKLRKTVVRRYTLLFFLYFIAILDCVDDQTDFLHQLLPGPGWQNTL
jgi:uncharacterized membrane protein YhaH (DUF805 family)